MSDDSNSPDMFTKFEQLQSQTNLEELNTYDKKTPKFTLKNMYKICRIVDVYDGDTVRGVFEHNGQYNKWTIRMYGYDSPEMKPSRKLENRLEIKAKALEAREYLKSLILNQNVYLHCLDFDKYGRVLANIYTPNLQPQSVNDHMVEIGHGYAYYGGTKKK